MLFRAYTKLSAKTISRTKINVLSYGNPEEETMSNRERVTTGIGNKDILTCTSIQEEKILPTVKVQPDDNFKDTQASEALIKIEGGEVQFNAAERSIHVETNTCGESMSPISVNIVKTEDGSYQELVDCDFKQSDEINSSMKYEEIYIKCEAITEDSSSTHANTCSEEEMFPINVDMIKKEDYHEMLNYEYDFEQNDTDFLIKNEEISVKYEEITEDDSYMQTEPQSSFGSHFSSDAGHQPSSDPTANKAETVTNVEILKCDKCKYHTRYKSCFDYHKLFHSDSNMYECNVCLYKTKRKDTLHYHMNRHLYQPGTDLTSSKQPGSDFTPNKQPGPDLTPNKPKIPIKLEVLKCDKCSYHTCYKSCFDYHKLFHPDSKIYECNVCFFKTNRRQSLHYHMDNHLCPTDRPTYKCDLCPYEARYKRSVDRHRVTHCPLCPFQGRTADFLDKHIKLHHKS